MHFRSSVLLGLAPCVLAKVQFLGVAIAGGDFGCQIDGTCPTSSVQFASDATGQMQHFVGEGLNLMRIPTSWQYLVNNDLGGDLDSSNFGTYNQLIEDCLDTGAYCMIDIHNFARWNGGIIGQGGPTDDEFVSLWTQLATNYATDDKVVFELMNEPHDLDIDTWAATLQKVVTAIRNAGATSQMILLSGTNFDSAATLVSSGSAAALMSITNPDGSTDGLILDIHKYLDIDNSGTHEECVTNNVGNFTTLASFLRENGRQGIISESGASSDASCFTNFCEQNAFINQNSDVFLGFVAWAAGSFSTSYVLSLTPTQKNGQYVDNQLMTQCVLGTWEDSSNATVTVTTASSTASSTAFSTASSAATSVASSAASSTASTSTTQTALTVVIGTQTSVIALSTMSMPTTLLMATGTPTVASMSVIGISTSAATAASAATTAKSNGTASTSTSASSATAQSESSTISRSWLLALSNIIFCGLVLGLFL